MIGLGANVSGCVREKFPFGGSVGQGLTNPPTCPLTATTLTWISEIVSSRPYTVYGAATVDIPVHSRDTKRLGFVGSSGRLRLSMGPAA